jgi:pimeloyl-ACP methyl ester carboxylesterase
MKFICPSFWRLVVTSIVTTGVAQENVVSDGSSNPERSSTVEAAPATGLPNVTTKTLGGRQFWGDLRHLHGWRIQQNVLTSPYRRLAGDDLRHAWGTREQCEAKLDEIKREKKLPEMSGEEVILIHGIARSSKSLSDYWQPLEQAGYRVFPFDDPSTRVDLDTALDTAAEFLHHVVQSLEGMERIHLVAHSMGGLVARTYRAKYRDDRLGRLVFVGSLQKGAELADLLTDKFNAVFQPLFGPAGQQLVTDPKGFLAKLPTPDLEFCVIAGSHAPDGFNPLIPGDDDGVVSVSSTRLPGAADFLQVESVHLALNRSEQVTAATVRFLQTGKLRAEGDAQPIPRE